MKQICTLIAAVCLLVIGQTLYAQSVTVSTTNPGPITPGFGPVVPVDGSTGFLSTNTTKFQEFSTGQTTTITTPFLIYPSIPTKIYFRYYLTINNGNGAKSNPVATVSVSNGPQNLTVTPGLSLSPGGDYYYFTIDFGSTPPATNAFKVSLTLELDKKDNTITAVNFQSNAPTTSNSSTLPVSFTGFYANKINNGVSLTWKVATETDVNGYEVQRSTDGSNFSKIGFVAATNSSSYSFVDSKGGSVVYYRIKSIDVDGKYSYSIVANIKGLESDVVMKAFPMPVQSQLTVQHSAANGNSKLEILSTDGRMIKALTIAEGAQQTSIDLSSAKSGVYVVRFVSGLNIQTAKIIKQ